VQVSVGINNSLNANNIKLYPNPTESNAIIAFNDLAKNHTVVVTDITGRIIDTYSNVTEKQMTINSNNYTTGLYFVQISNEMNETATVKLAVK
jgi:glycine cleavage system H lipoate-binding protein